MISPDSLSHKSYPAGLVLGRFQPFHPGHAHLISTAFDECDHVTVLIGSAQLADPLTIEERVGALSAHLTRLYSPHRYTLLSLVDPSPMATWPEVVSSAISPYPTPCAFYRADHLEPHDEASLLALGFALRYLPRLPFTWIDPLGHPVISSSATDIRRHYASLNMELTLPSVTPHSSPL